MSPSPCFIFGSPRLVLGVGVGVAMLIASAADAGDLLRGGATMGARARAAASGSNAGAAAAARANANARDRLARTTRSLNAVKDLQTAARNAASHPHGKLIPNLPRARNGLRLDGLLVAPGVPKDLTDPQPGEKPSLWTGAELPTQTKKKGGESNVTIVQTDQQAVLNWAHFDIGRKTTLTFDQSAGGENRTKWVAFNKVNDPSGKPSQILGKIKADGQVYVINQNGIIFGGASQVNVHTLVASALPINDNLIASGLINNPDSQFLFSALKLPAGANGTPAFVPDPSEIPDQKFGDVIVKGGAELTSPTSAAKVGGRIALVGANVENAGTISTPDGQVILAAGLQVGFDASTDPSLRGLNPYVGAVLDPTSKRPLYAGTATNSGLIDAPRASVTITGKDVAQLGFIDSSTSVSFNGRVDLRANYDAVTNGGYDPVTTPDSAPFVFRSAGLVTLGEDSVIRITPEKTDDTIIGTKLALSSEVHLQGQAIHFGKKSTVLAPSATVTADAGVWYYQPSTSQGGLPISKFLNSTGQIYVDRGALLDVAGSTDVLAPRDENIVTVQFRGAELADSPLQRGGPLRGTDIILDLRDHGTFNGVDWIGTPLANAQGFADLILRSAAELTTAGGSVDLKAGGSVVLQRGSKVDVSGGWVRYGAGFVETSLVVSGNQVIDIADATPDLVYSGFYSNDFTTAHAKWGITSTFAHPLSLSNRHFESAYVSGRDGGSISITAPTMAIDGDLAGNTTAGTRQIRDSASRSDLPVSSRVSLVFQRIDTQPYPNSQFPLISPETPDVRFANEPNQPKVAPFALDAIGNPLDLDPERAHEVVLSADLANTDGFGSITIDDAGGRIIVPEDVTLAFAPDGTTDPKRATVDFRAQTVIVRGGIIAPGGSLNFTASNVSHYISDIALSEGADSTFVLPPLNLSQGTFLLGPGGRLDTSGRLVDDRPDAPNPNADPLAITGGSVNVTAFNARLRPGSVIDVSGGVAMSATGTPTYGDAGGISLLAGQDPKVTTYLGGNLVLDGALRGFSGTTKGGSLALQAPRFRIGETMPSDRKFVLTPDFFNQGGFNSFSLTGIGAKPIVPEGSDRTVSNLAYIDGLVIEAGTTIAPIVKSWAVRPLNANGGLLSLVETIAPAALRATVSLAYASKNVLGFYNTKDLAVRGDLAVGAGATILAGPRGNVSFTGDTVSVLGTVRAPGGSISVTGAKSFPILNAVPTHARTTVYLGPESVLDASGIPLYEPNDFGDRKGEVLAGGSISLTGNILAEARALLDVSGSSAMFDLNPAQAGLNALLQPDGLSAAFVPVTSGLTTPLASRLVVPVRLDSDGGKITLQGGEQLFVDSRLRGDAGGPTALGGTLSVASGRFYGDPNDPRLPTDVNLVVRQNGPRIADDLVAPGKSGIGLTVLNADGHPRPGMGYFSIDRFARGGFDSLDLGGVVSFRGPVSIDARQRLSVASGGVLYANDAVDLTAPYVALGTPFLGPLGLTDPARLGAFTFDGKPYFFPAAFGDGRLTVRADLIDIGNLSLQQIGSAHFIADGGDIRGDGTLSAAGEIYLRAGQIYPTTAATFTISARDYFADAEDRAAGGNPHPGSVRIVASGARQLPLSAGGTLNIYATRISQNGTLRAPLGTINLGWDGEGDAPLDLISGHRVAITDRLTLRDGSETSVSAADRGDGRPLIAPFGIVANGTSWIDPSGLDITAGGAPTKDVRLSAQNLVTEEGSTIDVRGGGDLSAYRFVPGQGGSTDILASTGSFAVIPSYEANYAPFAPFSSGSDATALNGDPGYVNSSLKVGDRVYLGASNGLAAGLYTLLPARYALLPGGVLVTPKSGAPVGTRALPEGASLVSGYRFNALNPARPAPAIYTQFEVAPASVFRARAEYEVSAANTFLRRSARTLGADIPRLPIDSGHLVFEAAQTLDLRGTVAAIPPDGGVGAYVDISSSADILITGDGRPPKPVEKLLVLNAAELSAFQAESLFIGGERVTTADGVSLDVKTSNLTVDNAGSPLSAPEIILASRGDLTLARDAAIVQTGEMRVPAERLTVDGDGTLLRVSSDANAAITRTGVTSAQEAKMTIGAGATLSGASLILDSSYATDLDPRARLLADAVSLDSGQISLQLEGAGKLSPTDGLVLAGAALRDLRGVSALSLLSYSSIDIYGHGRIDIDGPLTLRAAEIRGFHAGKNGRAIFSATDLTLDNKSRGVAPGTSADAQGTLVFNSDTVHLGAGRISVDQYAKVQINAADHVLFQGNGSLGTQGDLAIRTPFIDATNSSVHRVVAGGNLNLSGGNAKTILSGDAGLGATLKLRGQRVTANTDIFLPSGLLDLRATQGDLTVGGKLSAGGTAQTLFDQVRYTSGGEISLAADHGSVSLKRGSVVDVAAQSGGGNAGRFTVITPEGKLNLGGDLFGQAGRGGESGTFALDVGSLPETAALNAVLDAAEFTLARTIRVRAGDVLIGGDFRSHTFNLAADHGDITVTGSIDASGVRGGAINLFASGSLTLADGAELTVAAQRFDAAGKGGAISLEAGSAIDGIIDPAAMLDLRSGASIDLSVAAAQPTSQTRGRFTGTLHLRAPQDATGTDVRIAAIKSTIRGASSIIAEGYKLFDLTPTDPNTTDAVITKAVQNDVSANAVAFIGTVGTVGTIDSVGTPQSPVTAPNVPGTPLPPPVTTPGQPAVAGVDAPGFAAMHDRLLSQNPNADALDSIFTIRAGAEIINRRGDLILGTSSTAANSATNDWDLGKFRFGSRNVAGVLTLRAAGNLVFLNALHDGFSIRDVNNPSTARPQPINLSLPLNAQSWSYRLTAGADLDGANFHAVTPLSHLADGSGSLLLGKNGVTGASFNPGQGAQTSTVLQGHYQVIRTGTGDIDITAGRDVQLLNQFATIYTAGVFVEPTLGGTFDPPRVNAAGGDFALGSVQQRTPYQAYYTMAGGNVSIAAQGDIKHLTSSVNNEPIEDSERQMPINWLYRRGYVDKSTGEFGAAYFGDIASTTWWVDFSNFFEGVGALGGGNVSLIAGHDVTNVDAVAPTNARMPIGKPDASKLVELGGGDVLVRAGHDIDGGVYYVERGNGVLEAGNTIHTNGTRSPSIGFILGKDPNPAEQTWLPTTLFVGKGTFDVSARGDVRLGPVVNPFLLPGGYNNSYWYKTYFSTYAPTTAVNVSSLGGSVTLSQSATLPGSDTGSTSLLQAWFANVLLYDPASTPERARPSSYQPWLRLNETSVDSFTTAFTLLPPTLQVTALQGDIDIAGDLTLAPASRGNLELLAGGSINGLVERGLATVNGETVHTFATSRINLSDARPGAIFGAATPFAYQTVIGAVAAARSSGHNLFASIDALFAETGSTVGKNAAIQIKQTLHAASLLHADDPDPLRVYAGTGDVSGVTLFSPKATRVFAGNDVIDIAFYLQNLSDDDVSIVSAGRDIIPFNANAPLRAFAATPGNVISNDEAPLAGDLQINGPGTLEVFAGRNLDLGLGENNVDGTGVGISSIGNARNPYLPFNGASIIAGAGIGPSTGLVGGSLDFASFIEDFVLGDAGTRYLSELSKAASGSGDNSAATLTPAAFALLSPDAQTRVALDVFYLALRDAGRDHGLAGSSGFGNYAAGFDAIATLFAKSHYRGDINTRSRDIRTRAGGDIDLFAPGGKLTLSQSALDNQLAPPGIITETGGNVNIFTDGDVDIGIGRIFTLRGGNMVIWSSTGDIAAGSASKTVASAPPTRVIIDPQSADVATDLAGLATGGGIGVLATVEGVPPGDVDLIAPVGVVDAGDAGIRVSGNLNIAATAVLNASNIAVIGTTSGVPTAPTVAAPNIAGLTSASKVSGATNSAANDLAKQANNRPVGDQPPSVYTVQVVGYGGSNEEDEEKKDDEEKKKEKEKKQDEGQSASAAAPGGAGA